METEYAPRCVRCGKPMSFAGRISLPPQMIYRCEACRTEIWTGSQPAPAPLFTEQPSQQQQQQPQPKKDDE
jgi:DNA-directed RNA polymerase subunit RPC12/RpoP